MPYKQDPWYLSKRVYASVVGVLVLLLSLFGFDVGEGFQETIVESLTAIGIAVTAILAAWSKVKEKKKVKEDDE